MFKDISELAAGKQAIYMTGSQGEKIRYADAPLPRSSKGIKIDAD